jgi:hypothetical protein
MNRKTVLNSGDIVVITPENFRGDNLPFDLKVTKIAKRYGYEENGTQTNHLVTGTRIDNGEESVGYNFGFITEIKSRGKSKPQGLPENILRNSKRDKPVRKGGKVSGTFFSLLIYGMGKLPYCITQKIHDERALELFHTQNPGLIGGDSWGRYTVTEKVFDNWIAKNWSKFLLTTKEMVLLETEDIKASNDLMREDMECWERKWEQDDCREYEMDMPDPALF